MNLTALTLERRVVALDHLERIAGRGALLLAAQSLVDRTDDIARQLRRGAADELEQVFLENSRVDHVQS